MCGYANNHIVFCFIKPLLVNIVGNMHIPTIIGNKKYFPVFPLQFNREEFYPDQFTVWSKPFITSHIICVCKMSCYLYLFNMYT